MEQRAAPSDVEPAVAPPPGSPRFPHVDALRALAALAVLVFHAGQATDAPGTAWYGGIVVNLSVGVQVFFVISAFLLYRPFFAASYLGHPRPRTRDYMRRRVLRIVPAYWLALTLLAIYPGLVGVFTGDWWVYYGFMQVYDADTLLAGLPQAWSLCVEASFYVALPVYALAMRRVCRGRDRRAIVRIELVVLATLVLVSLAWRTVSLESDSLVGFLTLPALFLWFAPGMALAVASVVLREGGASWRPAEVVARMPWIPWALSAVAFGAVVATTDVDTKGVPPGAWEMIHRSVLTVAAAALLLIPAVSGPEAGGAIRRLLSWPVLAWLGLVSYGIFLWHHTVVGWLMEQGVDGWLPGDGFAVLTVATFALATTLAAASYYAVERPFLRLKDRHRGGPSTSTHGVEDPERDTLAHATPW